MVRPLWLKECSLAGGLVLRDASAFSIHLEALTLEKGLDARNLVTSRDLELVDGFRADGPVRLEGARIAGSLCLGGARLHHPGGNTLDAPRIEVGGSLELNRGFSSSGQIFLRGARGGGQLNCADACLVNTGGKTLCADRSHWGGGVALNKTFLSLGEVFLRGSDLDGQLNCSSGRIYNPGGIALNVNRMHARGGIALNSGFKAVGVVDLLGASTQGQANFASGRFFNPGGRAIWARRLEARQGLVLTKGARVEGTLNVEVASIGGYLDCVGATFGGAGDEEFSGQSRRTAIAASGLRLDGDLRLGELGRVVGDVVDLSGATVQRLSDRESTWPEGIVIDVDGFKYEYLQRWGGDPVSERLRWLERQSGFVPSGYDQLARYFEAHGETKAAVEVRIERERRRTSAVPFGFLGGLWRRVWGGLVGYGYKPWRAVVILALVIAGMGVLFAVGASKGRFEPVRDPKHAVSATTCTESYPCFSPLMYSADVALPVIDFGQQEYWSPDGRSVFATLVWIEIVGGWILTGALVAAVSRLFSSD